MSVMPGSGGAAWAHDRPTDFRRGRLDYFVLWIARQRNRRASEQQPTAARLVQPKASEHQEGPESVLDASREGHARGLQEVARRDRQLDNACLAGDDLGENFLIEDKPVRIAQERDSPEEWNGERAVTSVVLGEVAAKG